MTDESILLKFMIPRASVSEACIARGVSRSIARRLYKAKGNARETPRAIQDSDTEARGIIYLLFHRFTRLNGLNTFNLLANVQYSPSRKAMSAILNVVILSDMRSWVSSCAQKIVPPFSPVFYHFRIKFGPIYYKYESIWTSYR